MNTIGRFPRVVAYFLTVVAVISGSAISHHAGAFVQGEFWQKKDYTQWSESDCKKLLENSPWAQKWSVAQAVMEHVKDPANDLNRENTPTVFYQVQLRSALPVRQAIVRLAQIKQKYDKMTPEQKKGIDQQTAPYLADNYKDRIVFYVAYGSNVRTDDANLALYWQKQSVDMMKNNVFLINQRGERIPIINFTVNGGAAREFQFDFPRELGGKPVILPDDKTAKLEFVHPDIGMPTQRVLISFNPSKMMVGGSAIY